MGGGDVGVVLGGGESKRMRSKTAKILHPCAGKPLLRWSVDAAVAAGARPVIVLSPDVEAGARAILPPGTAVALQKEMRGTGDAVRVALAAVPDQDGEAFVIYGDTPTLSAATLERLPALRAERGAAEPSPPPHAGPD